MPTLNETPSANRLHIAIYGRRNAGKSSLINALTDQPVALVSDIPGTTTDPVRKAMEVRGLGACMLIDTAGFDDEGELGALRVQKTGETIPKADIALLLCSDEDLTLEQEWSGKLKAAGVRQIAVISKADEGNTDALAEAVRQKLGMQPLLVSAKTREGIPALLTALARAIPEGLAAPSILGGLAKAGDTVLLVMPQDSEAPKGRLILPQVQTIRELLDTGCVSINVTPDTLDAALAALKEPPALIITDSQVFREVYEKTPAGSRLTSFSVLFAAHKGDLAAFVEGARAADRLTEHSRVLIAEACTHAPLSEDIGRVKIPAMLRKKFGAGLQIDIVSGTNFPEKLDGYDLIVHCGGCMFNRTYLLSRVQQAKDAGVPITNYGVLIAKMKGILDKVSLPNH
ncbi:MAG: [FeFe] hydrogenase H-cluster maturation GTPase HydF [Butyricicoccus sp.]|nr:[FeFe] hydrogenase H-cluster maturation GTPase HydF [Butyricicoccus sp.]